MSPNLGDHRFICPVFTFPAWVMVLNLSKKVHFFCNFVLTSAENLSLLKQFPYIHLKDLIMHFQKMVLFIMLWLTVSKIIRFWSQRILLNFCRVSIFFYILITNISWLVAQNPISHVIFWMSKMRTFRFI